MLNYWFVAESMLKITGFTTLYKSIDYLHHAINWIRNNDTDIKDVKKVIQVLKINDVMLKTKVVKSMEQEFKDTQIESIPSVKICLEELTTTVNDLEFILLKVKDKMEKCNSMWFSYLRSPSFKSEIDSLDQECKVFEKRFNLFVKLVNVQHAKEHIQVIKKEDKIKLTEMNLT